MSKDDQLFITDSNFVSPEIILQNGGVTVRNLSEIVGGCNCEGYLYWKMTNDIVIVLHPHNSLEDAKWCMTKLEENRPISVRFEYVIRLTDSAYKFCKQKDAGNPIALLG